MSESQTSIYYPPPEERRCTARSKQSGRQCGRWAAKGSHVCYYHGARSTGPRTREGLERSRSARLVHGESALDILKIRLLKRVLMAAAEQNSILQVFPEYVARKLESMSARQFRDARKSLVAFLKGDISAQGLISHLDGKKPKAVLCSEQDKAYLLRIKKLLLQGSNANS